MKVFGWEVAKTKNELNAISRGDQSVQKSTIETFSRAKKSIDELLKVAEKVFEALGEKKSKLQQSGLDTLKGIKKGMQKLTSDLPKILEARLLHNL